MGGGFSPALRLYLAADDFLKGVSSHVTPAMTKHCCLVAPMSRILLSTCIFTMLGKGWFVFLFDAPLQESPNRLHW